MASSPELDGVRQAADQGIKVGLQIMCVPLGPSAAPQKPRDSLDAG